MHLASEAVTLECAVIGVVAAAILAAVGYWAYDSYRTKQTDEASAAFWRGVTSAQAGDDEKAFTAFGEAASKNTAAYKALGLMSQGAIRVGQDKTTEAVALFDAAAKATNDPLLKDSARLKSALALLDSAPYAAIEERLKPLLEDKRPYRPLAREALGMAKLKAGRAKEARADFVVLTLSPSVPETVRQRAQGAISLIDSGSAAGVPGVVKAMQAMPKGPAAAPPMPQTQSPQAGAAE
ncbi:MAG: tetratricopeptide repeat protein [Caulobacteraceae bacterium]